MYDRNAYKYDRTIVRTTSGRSRHSYTNGDAVAIAMLGLEFEEILDVMHQNGLEDRLEQYADRPNHGQFRMLLGNSLRALIRHGTPVLIGDHVIRSLDQKISSNGAPAKPDAKPVAKKSGKKKGR